MRKAVLIGLVLLGIWAVVAERGTHAQSAASALPPVMCWQVVHTACVIAPGTTTYALASDGPWVSMNGGAWAQIQIGPPVAAAITINNQTGTKFTIASTNTAPVASVAVTAQ